VESCLKQCLDSVLAQSLAAAEVIVINDGSTDRTAEVAQSYGEQVVYLEQDNQGQGAARNAGLKIARGTYIAFLDADDYWLPGFLEATTAFLSEHDEAVAVNTGLIARLHDGTELIRPALLTGPDAPVESFIVDVFFSFWAEHDHVRTGSVLIRKNVIDLAGGQRADLRISQDLEYWGYIATFGKWGYIPKLLWVGNSRQAAMKQGWLKKYKNRRKLCPDVEQWGSRIEPRLKPGEREAYEIVRGRVAMGYAQNKILGGASESAYRIVKKYGSTMPTCAMTRVMLSGASFGPLGWAVACSIIQLKERFKSLWIRLSQQDR
jgi:glycosyltransferase involved in cell wall biosynthesis